MTTKHTPGPWLLRTAPTSAGLCHIVSAADWRGAFIYGDGLRKGVDDALPKAQELAANARLIAAAPSLLEALQAIMPFTATMAIGCHGEKCREPWCHSCNGEDEAEEAAQKGCDAFAKARAAIARATGEQP